MYNHYNDDDSLHKQSIGEPTPLWGRVILTLFLGFCVIFAGMGIYEKFKNVFASGAKKDSRSTVYYSTCADARADGVTPIHRGNPGYRDELDRDGDGTACEPYQR